MHCVSIFIVTILALHLSAADLRLARLFSDHAVLQRDREIPIWGWSDPNATVAGTLASSNATTVADHTGRFVLRFPAQAAGGPHELTLRCGAQTLIRRDLLIGEVWLACGQSNMLFAVEKATGGSTLIAEADAYPQLRLFHAVFHPAREPVADVHARPDRFVNGAWKCSGRDTIAHFSAVAYQFGRGLQTSLDVPVGIIQSCWHSTPIEPWVPPAVLATDFPHLLDQWAASERDFDPKADRDAAHKVLIAQWEKARDAAVAAGRPVPPWPNKPPDQATLERDYPGRLFNGMIEPLIPYGMRGVLWYQGESNAWRSWEYRQLFPALITGWRNRWQQELPFLAVELAAWHPQKTTATEPVEAAEPLPSLREAQRVSAASTPQVWLASAVDLHDRNKPHDIHPPDKISVGQRLVLLARRHVYGDMSVIAEGPCFAELTVRGAEAEIRFTNADGGLALRDGTVPTGFALAGADGVYHWATARIADDRIILSCPAVTHPVHAAYAWAAIPNGNLVNRAGLPASPFRSDHGKRHSQP